MVEWPRVAWGLFRSSFTFELLRDVKSAGRFTPKYSDTMRRHSNGTGGDAGGDGPTEKS